MKTDSIFIVIEQTGWDRTKIKKIFSTKEKANSWAKKMQTRVSKDRKPQFDDWGQIEGVSYYIVKRPLE